MRRHMRSQGVVIVLAVVLGVVVLGGCKPPPPALTKAELSAAKLPDKHPKLAENPAADCRSCHKEQPAIKQP